MATPTADIGLIGLAVMGENLVLNMESHGNTVAVFNRTTSKVDGFVNGRGRGKKVVGCHTVEDLIAALKRPRKIMIMVKAGAAVDDVIDELTPLLSPGDILIDGGNTHYPDTTRRTRALKEKGILFVRTGVSGGEEGALKGPSIMPGGNPGPLDSYVIEITRDILGFSDPESGKPMVDLILDTAGQKGTGKWTVNSALDLGVPLTLIAEAVFARCLSAQKDERVAASKVLHGPEAKFTGDRDGFINDVEAALYASKIISYAQGFALMNAMAKESGWTINNGAVALMWRGGCIIPRGLPGEIRGGGGRNPPPSHPPGGSLLPPGGWRPPPGVPP